MQKVLSKDGVILFEPKPAADEMLLRVYTKSYLKEVKQAWYDKGASLAEEVKKCAEEGSEGHTLIITHGGYLREVAEYIFPNIVEILIRP